MATLKLKARKIKARKRNPGKAKVGEIVNIHADKNATIITRRTGTKTPKGTTLKLPSFESKVVDKGFFGHMTVGSNKKSSVIKGGINGGL